MHSGDPSLYGAVMEQIELCDEIGLDWEIVPGVSSLGAAAAAIGRELTVRDLPVRHPDAPREPHSRCPRART